MHQVVQVPLQLLGGAADAGGPRDDAHAFGHHQLPHGLAQFLAILAFDPARNAAAARIVRHQHQVAASQRDEGRQRGALVATLFLLDLDDQLLAFVQGVLDARVADVDAVLEERASDFLERQEAMPLFAVIDEAGFERRLDAGNDTLVDVALALFAPGRLDVDVDQFLTIDDGDAQFFLLRRVEQHAFHRNTSLLSRGSHRIAVPAAIHGAREGARGGVRIARNAGASMNAAGRARVKERETSTEPTAGERRNAGHCSIRSTPANVPVSAAVRGKAGRNTALRRHRDRPRKAKTRQRANLSDAARLPSGPDDFWRAHLLLL